MQGKNPWTLERLNGLIGQEESYTLEFKSSKALLGKPSEVDTFFNDLSADVSAFMNADGGDMIIGIEEVRGNKEQAGKAERLSDGIPRGVLTPDVFERKLCDRIQPAVASYVRVFSVKVSERDGVDLLAYVVTVKAGMTAYQAPDKRYHGRRSFSTFQMDDKDVRLRMLTDDRPRADVQIVVKVDPADVSWGALERDLETYEAKRQQVAEVKAQEPEGSPALVTAVADLVWMRPASVRQFVVTLGVYLQNTGNVTIRRGAINWKLELDSGSMMEPRSMDASGIEEFVFDVEGKFLLYPEMTQELLDFRFAVPRNKPSSDDESALDLVVYLDGGQPVRRRITLMASAKEQLSTAEARLSEIKQANRLGPDW